LSSAEISTVPRLADERRDTLQPLPTLAPDAPPAAEPDLAAPPVDGLAALLDLIDARLADGRLLTADSDSAKAYFEQALRLNPLDPRLLARRAALAAGLVDAAHDAVAREDFAAAQRLAEEAFRLGAERAALARLDSELESARTLARHAEALSAARA